MVSIVACCRDAKLCAHAAWDFDRNTTTHDSKVFSVSYVLKDKGFYFIFEKKNMITLNSGKKISSDDFIRKLHMIKMLVECQSIYNYNLCIKLTN